MEGNGTSVNKVAVSQIFRSYTWDERILGLSDWDSSFQLPDTVRQRKPLMLMKRL